MALKFANNNSLSAITSTPSGVGGGSLNLISTQTASSSATIDFTSGLDSTYKEFIFKLINIHPQTNDETLSVNFRDGGTDYDAVKTTTSFRAYHNEADGVTGLGYVDVDLAQSTAVQGISFNLGSDADQCMVGYLHLFSPADTTFVKHFLIRTCTSHASDYVNEWHIAGYCNTTSAIDGVQFKMSSGNIDSGTIKLYGVS